MAIGMMFIAQISAQVLYPTQPKTGYYENLKKNVIQAIPNQSDLVNAKVTVIPNNFKDTLLKYDWYEISSYGFFDKEYKTDFGKDLTEREEKYANNEFSFKRYTPAGILYEMKLDRYKDASLKVFTTTFDEKTATKLVEIKKQGTKNMMVTSSYGETEMQEIISYQKGVMIMSIRQNPTTNTRKYHIAYLAVEKSF